VKNTGRIFETKTEEIVRKEFVRSIEGPAESLKCAMRGINGYPAISRFNVNGGEVAAWMHESDSIIDSLVAVRFAGYVVIDRVV